MNQPDDPVKPNAQPSSADKDRPVLQDAPPARPGHEVVEASDSGKPWVVGMVAGAMLIIGLVIGSLLWSPPDMRPYVEPFLESVSQQDYAKAYSLVGPEWRGMMPEKDFAAMHKVLHEKLGDFISLKQKDIQENDHPVLGKVNFVNFEARFTNGKVDLTAILHKTPKGWSLLNLEYVTPLLTPVPAVAPARRSQPRKKPKAPAPAPARSTTQPAAPASAPAGK